MPQNDLQKRFQALGSKEVAEHAQRFFKTEPGEYGHGDIFLGIRMPVIRKFVKEHRNLEIEKVLAFVRSKFHEERMLGLLFLVDRYKSSKVSTEKDELYQLYLDHFSYVNNWDLVDVTCPHIVGPQLMNLDRSILKTWAQSEHLWTRRIAMVSHWWFIRHGDLNSTFDVANLLLQDEHDLMHKAVGWMLREAGKKDFQRTDLFLLQHYQNMPRTTLRYAIEKFPEARRQAFLKGTVT